MSEETTLRDRGIFRRASIKSYCARWSTPNPQVIFDQNVAAVLADQGFVWEQAPRSKYDPQQLYTSLERYATDWSDFEFSDSALEYGFAKAYKIFAKPKDASLLCPDEDLKSLLEGLKLTKSSGLPMMTTKEVSLTYSLNRANQILMGTKVPNPCVAYARTGADDRTRLVWGYPMEMTIIETRFARPLINNFKGMRTPMAIGLSKTEIGARIHAYVVNSLGTEVCMDYSKYDQTMSAKVIKMAFRILETWFSKEDRNRLGWKTIVRYFIHTPIVMPNGRLYTNKHHGVPSGSYFTQLIDSIVNVMLIYSLKRSCGLSFDEESLMVMGDDSIFAVRSDVNVELWASKLSKYGIILHTDDKTRVGEAHFLGAVWKKGKPYRDLQELVNNAVFPEKFRDYQGKPDTGAEDVLRSYAGSYLNAWQLLPHSNQMNWLNAHYRPSLEHEERFLTGSDAFLRQEGWDISKSGFPAWLSLRILT